MSKNAYSMWQGSEDPTEHQSLASGVHPDEWRPGATCDDCERAHAMTREVKRGVGPNYNLSWLKNSNEAGITAMGMVKEIEDGARESGKDIRHVGGSTKQRKDVNDRIRKGEV